MFTVMEYISCTSSVQHSTMYLSHTSLIVIKSRDQHQPTWP